MKYAVNAACRIAYERFGAGPPVVLQHGFLDDRGSWERLGYVAALSPHFTVIAVDSLGHGDSDKPIEQQRYLRRPRVSDITSVLDQEQIGRAHFVGYSMGSWLGMGLVAYQPERLLSLTLGGWNPSLEDKTPNPVAGMGIEQFLEVARLYAPAMVARLKPDSTPGLAACLAAFEQEDISGDVLAASGLPLHFWVGRDDSCHDPVVRLHRQLAGSVLTEIPSDHVGAFEAYSAKSAAAIKRFLMDPRFDV